MDIRDEEWLQVVRLILSVLRACFHLAGAFWFVISQTNVQRVEIRITSSFRILYWATDGAISVAKRQRPFNYVVNGCPLSH